MNGEDMRALLDEIAPDDLPAQWQELAASVGLVNLLQLCKLYGGTSLYIPKYDNLIAPAKRRAVAKLFDGKNHKELARRFELSERSVYEIASELSAKVRSALFLRHRIFELCRYSVQKIFCRIVLSEKLDTVLFLWRWLRCLRV